MKLVDVTTNVAFRTENDFGVCIQVVVIHSRIGDADVNYWEANESALYCESTNMHEMMDRAYEGDGDEYGMDKEDWQETDDIVEGSLAEVSLIKRLIETYVEGK